MDFDFLTISADLDNSEQIDWDQSSAMAIWEMVDSLVPVFGEMLETQMGLTIRHEWDDGLTFFDNGDCAKGCDGGHHPARVCNCYCHKADWREVETQMEPRTKGLFILLKRMVPLYLDANTKVG